MTVALIGALGSILTRYLTAIPATRRAAMGKIEMSAIKNKQQTNLNDVGFCRDRKTFNQNCN